MENENAGIFNDQLYFKFLNIIDSFVIFISQDKKIITWNREAEKCFGIPEEYALSKQLLELPLIWDHEKILQIFIEFENGAVSSSIPEMQIEKPDNTKKWISIKIYNLSNEKKIIPVILLSDMIFLIINGLLNFSRKITSSGQ